MKEFFQIPRETIKLESSNFYSRIFIQDDIKLHTLNFTVPLQGSVKFTERVQKSSKQTNI